MKNNNLNIFTRDLSVQDLSVQKRDSRMEYRLSAQLKSIIEYLSQRKNLSAGEMTIQLWLDYLSKAKLIKGKVVKADEQQLKDDVEHFLKNA